MRTIKRLAVASVLLAALFLGSDCTYAGENNFLYVASRTNGIARYRLDLKGGAMTDFAVASAAAANPQYFAWHPKLPVLYTINMAVVSGKKQSVISAFGVNAKTGDLTLINQEPTGPGGPTHLCVDHAGKNVLVANYGGGSVFVLPIKAGGALGERTSFIQHQGSSIVPQRQDGPHAHQVLTDSKDRFALVCDLGLDKVLIYQFDPKNGTLKANEPAFATLKPGAGPRHLAFHPNGKFVYVINELNSTMTAFSFDEKKGELTELQTLSTLPEGFDGKNSTAEVYVHPNGKFVYGSNRGHDSIVVFAIGKDGKLSLVQRQSTLGKTPRHFGIHPNGKLLCAENQETQDMFTFEIDPSSGKLKPTGQKVELSSPTCVEFYPNR